MKSTFISIELAISYDGREPFLYPMMTYIYYLVV